jgi:lipopolysaccharide transport system permease protein
MIKAITAAFSSRKVLYVRDLLRELVAREMKGGYRDSVLGMAWSVLTPLMYLLVFYLIFQQLFAVGVQRYSSFAFIGMTVWTWFQASLLQAVGVIRNSRDLVLQPGFPTPVLPAVSVATALINFVISLPILMILLLLEQTRPGIAILWLPILIAVQFLLILSFAYLVAALNVPFRDTQHILAVLLQLFFFATPIFYDISKLPQNLQWIFVWNPMAALIESYRGVLMHNQSPSLLHLGVLTSLSLGLAAISFKLFVRASHRFVEEL